MENNRSRATTHHQPASPRFPSGTPTAGAQRKIAIAVDLSDESAHAVKWAVQNYLRLGDAIILLHVRPTSVLYGADWAAAAVSTDTANEKSQQKLEDDFDNFTTSKARERGRENALMIPVLVKKLLRVSDTATALSVSILSKVVRKEEDGGESAVAEVMGAGAFEKVLLVLQIGGDEKTKELLKTMDAYRSRIRVDCVHSLELKHVKRAY